VEKTTHRTL